jgi:hypothetical protein
VIPESAEVLWPDTPQTVWFELSRASYWSFYQMAGMVFSREAAMLGTQRQSRLSKIMPQLGALNSDKHIAMTRTPRHSPGLTASPCELPDVTFYASWLDLGPTAYPPVVPDNENPREKLYLYACHDTAH